MGGGSSDWAVKRDIFDLKIQRFGEENLVNEDLLVRKQQQVMVNRLIS